MPWRSLAIQETYRFERDMAELGVIRPTYEPRSHDFVAEVIALAAALVDQGAAYERNGSVYFRAAGVAERAGLNREQAIALARETWRAPRRPRQGRPSRRRCCGNVPPGTSRPGRVRGAAGARAGMLSARPWLWPRWDPVVDLHVGGSDLAFPHHAYEAAQAEAFTGARPFARCWMHVGNVLVDGQKMAKSAGNLVFVQEVLERFPAGALRLLILSRHWAEPWEFDEASLERGSPGA